METGINVGALTAFGPDRVGGPVGAWRTALSARALWKDVDASPVQFDEFYPPLPPPFTNGQLLTDALTDAFCCVYSERAVVGNQRYRWVGELLLKMASSYIAYKQLPCATPAELDDIRLECIDDSLLARFGLITGLDIHLRMLRPVGDENRATAASPCAAAFCAFVAAVHLQHGASSL